ncbi:MAG: sensor histidine kinase [Anaerolineales bacterium]|nr:sensor histidine kinase [Anaerolineales bacterium]MCA9927333.1 sensor histidine kinase [Anaerolineales bacterium]
MLRQKFMKWMVPSVSSQGVLRWGFISAYISLIGAVMVYINAINVCAGSTPFRNAVWIAALLVLLVAIERFEIEQATFSMPMVIFFLLARTAVIWGIVQIDCTSIAASMYSVIPFAIFFSIGRRVSVVTGTFFWLLTVYNLGQSGANWVSDPLANVGIVLLTLTLIFIQVIAFMIAANERQQEQTRQLLAELKVSHEKLHLYAAQVGELVAAEERNRLARDIHDSLGHHLTAVNIQLEKALTFRSRNPSEADEAVQNAKLAAHEALLDVRNSVQALRETDTAFSLSSSLHDLIRGIDDKTVEVDLQVEGEDTGYAYPVLTTLFRVAQEGLTNVQKHAQASHVRLKVTLQANQAQLVLEDDGVGMDINQLEAKLASPFSFGLQGIQERLELVQGQMDLSHVSPHGTRLTVTVPKNPAQLFKRDTE